MHLLEFMKKYEPCSSNDGQGKLRGFEEDVLVLHKNGYSLAQIKSYLATKGVGVSRSAINSLIRKANANAK